MKTHQQIVAGYLIAGAVFCFDPTSVVGAASGAAEGGAGGGAPTPGEGAVSTSMEVLIELTAEDMTQLVAFGEGMEVGPGGALFDTRAGTLVFDADTAELLLIEAGNSSLLFEISAWTADAHSHVLLDPIEADGPALHFVYPTPAPGDLEPVTIAIIVIGGITVTVAVGTWAYYKLKGLFGNRVREIKAAAD